METCTGIRLIILVPLLTTLFFGLQGCGGGNSAVGNSAIIHNGTTYGTVVSPYTE